jgi:hypothetical protein
MENITITRISDLPDLGTSAQGQNQQGQNSYQPILNVHPNPYGIAQPSNGGLPPPIQTQEGPKMPQNIMYEPPPIDRHSAPSVRLPQRDIPMNMDEHIYDEQIKPNYVPKPKLTQDYIEEYQHSTDRKLKEYEHKKRVDKSRESWFDEFRIPCIITILFFIFHMPIINTLIFKRFAFLSIYNDDGNFNIYGLFLKSICFGVLFWILNRGMEYLGEI